MGLFNKIFKKQPKQFVDTSEILNQIDYKEGTLFAKNDTNKVYIDIEELGGFPYLKTVLFGDTKVKIKRTGCTISFISSEGELKLDSDNTDVESNEINKTGVFFTPIDFELDEAQAKQIQSNKITEVKFEFKGIVYSFKTV